MASTSMAVDTQLELSQPQMIPVRLTTRSTKHAIPDSKYMIPSDWRRYQLSELLNKVLGYETPIPFDFVVSDELLRTSLSDFAKTKGLSAETTLEVEYVESILPPSYISSFQHDDWVSDVQLARKGQYLTSSYDKLLRIYSSSSQLLYTGRGHEQPILSCCWIGSSNPPQQGGDWIASAGMDRSIVVWEVPTQPTADAQTTEPALLRQIFSLALHSTPIASVRSFPHHLTSSSSSSSRRRVISAGWDGVIGFWDLPERIDQDLENDVVAVVQGGEDGGKEGGKRKRRRVGEENGAGGIRTRAPNSVLRGHTATVTRAIFDRQDPTKVFSCGYDHSVRQWDLETGSELLTKNSNKVLLDMDQMASANLLVTGSVDKSVSFWDLRQAESNISLSLMGHTSQVSSVTSHPTSPLLLCSASFDSTIKIWDARSPKQSLFTIVRQPQDASGQTEGGERVRGIGDKVLCVDWDGEILASGGEDKRVQLHKANMAPS